MWCVLVDLDGWARWAPRVTVREHGAVEPGARFRFRVNGVGIRATFTVVDPERELAWSGAFLWFRAVDRQILEPLDGDRTCITFSESLDGVLLPLLYSESQLAANHRRWLEALRTHVENL